MMSPAPQLYDWSEMTQPGMDGGWTYGWRDERLDGWMSRWIEELMDGWTDASMDGQVEGSNNSV